ncbi:site-specific integrase [Chromobacterium vaccinii]|uniref:site-specific integrase n=1 Tax=Chromobacterium vaccinii TaxID=1108595 RepID=UPI000CE96169|nr:site-specific integrase [Chromobacterium vaccinii]AVG17071.1 site-specific integrase [Chromobacterium vaccinii]
MGAEREYEGVRPASKSTIEIDFYYAGERCKERIKLQPTPANMKRAAQHRAAILLAIDQGTFDYATTFPNSKRANALARAVTSKMLACDYIVAWLEKKALTIKSSTMSGYRKIVYGHLIGILGNDVLADLNRGGIREKLEKTNCSNKTLANIQSVLRTALNDALEDGLIQSNPVADWTYRKLEPPKMDDDIDPFTSEEQTRILNACEGQARNFIQFAFWTGLRTSELVALDWSDVDWKRRVIRVNKARTQKAVSAEDTKTRAGRREVKLLAPALSALLDQKQFTYTQWAEIFQNPNTGERWTGDQPIRKTMWQHALKRAKVRYRYPYQTRHTYASMMLSAGEHPMWVAKQMGHADWGMIRRTYGRWIPSEVDDAGSRAVAMFCPKPDEQ